MGQRFLAGVNRRPRYAVTVALVLAIGGLLALMPVTVGRRGRHRRLLQRPILTSPSW